MSVKLTKFIKFLSDLNRGCHVLDILEGWVYCLDVGGRLRFASYSSYLSGATCKDDLGSWRLDDGSFDAVSRSINTHALRIVYDPKHQPQKKDHVRRIEL